MSIYAKHDKIKQVYFANQLKFGVMSCTAPEQIKQRNLCHSLFLLIRVGGGFCKHSLLNFFSYPSVHLNTNKHSIYLYIISTTWIQAAYITPILGGLVRSVNNLLRG